MKAPKSPGLHRTTSKHGDYVTVDTCNCHDDAGRLKECMLVDTTSVEAALKLFATCVDTHRLYFAVHLDGKHLLHVFMDPDDRPPGVWKFR